MRFAPFTCVAGANGVGKSNLFDAIQFLGALAEHSITDAAASIREEGKSGDLRDLFSKGGAEHVREMTFATELIIPKEGVDEYGQTTIARHTYLRYELILAFEEPSPEYAQRIIVRAERLFPLEILNLSNDLIFTYSEEWRKSAIVARRGLAKPLIGTTERNGTVVIQRYQEGTQGRPRDFAANNSPRTVLSSSNAIEGATAALVRAELSSWRLLQFEPSALRSPSSYRDPRSLTSNGANLAATLQRLIISANDEEYSPTQELTNNLNQLIGSVDAVGVEDDSSGQRWIVTLTDRGQTKHSARALSDGTLRFLALSVLAIDPTAKGVICLEEPENGIHPERVAAMIQLLNSVAFDPKLPISDDNPLRQVIINTHSPVVVQQVPFEALLIATHKRRRVANISVTAVSFEPMPETMRARHNAKPFPLVQILPYMLPLSARVEGEEGKRVLDHSLVKGLLIYEMPL